MKSRVSALASSWEKIHQMIAKEKMLMEDLEFNSQLSFHERKKKEMMLYKVRREIPRRTRMIREIL